MDTHRPGSKQGLCFWGSVVPGLKPLQVQTFLGVLLGRCGSTRCDYLLILEQLTCEWVSCAPLRPSHCTGPALHPAQKLWVTWKPAGPPFLSLHWKCSNFSTELQSLCIITLQSAKAVLYWITMIVSVIIMIIHCFGKVLLIFQSKLYFYVFPPQKLLHMHIRHVHQAFIENQPCLWAL